MTLHNSRVPASAFRCALAALVLIVAGFALDQGRVIDVLADKDGQFKIMGQAKPEIVLRAGEPVVLRIEARKGGSANRNGAIHGFTLLRAKDHAKVAGWDLELRAGMQEFKLVAPAEPGDYEVFCTVICGGNHEDMRIKLTVVS